jgi:hypothetical protein
VPFLKCGAKVHKKAGAAKQNTKKNASLLSRLLYLGQFDF